MTLLLLMVGLLVPAKYADVKTRVTGEHVTAFVDACRYQNAGRGSGWRCTGDWTLADGTTGWGKLWGLEDRRTSGSPVAVYATRERAVTDSWSHIATFAAGVVALVALAVLAVWRYRQL
ncbi:hypothetical protein NMK54_22570 [Nocardia otitidiscaviarum]|uniref:hypothetical protein n=1 Tax=Nocardia otitidiscaviarum TaxID=1823 RepID=UPI0020CC3627|nr:hypothetical protein [Nocardia otitidiscaviarum]MCP9622938.1 hypothetical protein [Nocardia otitidiscaviarum]